MPAMDDPFPILFLIFSAGVILWFVLRIRKEEKDRTPQQVAEAKFANAANIRTAWMVALAVIPAGAASQAVRAGGEFLPTFIGVFLLIAIPAGLFYFMSKGKI